LPSLPRDVAKHHDGTAASRYTSRAVLFDAPSHADEQRTTMPQRSAARRAAVREVLRFRHAERAATREICA